MRRSAWIFFASIFLPSLGLAWLAVHSVRDQQVVLEHQQAIICQNITDALAKSVQAQMDQVRADFVKTTQQLLGDATSPPALAQNFNHVLRQAWPAAQIGFAVNLNGEIYSPKPFDGPEARTFRDENDRFLSNRENVEVYSSNATGLTQNAQSVQNAPAQFALKVPELTSHAVLDKEQAAKQDIDELQARITDKDTREDDTKRKVLVTESKNAEARGSAGALSSGKTAALREDDLLTNAPTGRAIAPAASDASATTNAVTVAPASPATPAPDSASAPAAAAALPAAAPVAAPPPPASTYNVAPGTAGGLPAPINAPTLTDTGSSTITAPAVTTTTTAPISQTIPATPLGGSVVVDNNAALPNNAVSSANLFFGKIQRQVIPQQVLTRDTASLSNTVPEESDFRRVIGTETSGELARFLEDKMRLLVWSHATTDAPIVFGAQLDPAKLVDTLQASLQNSDALPPYEKTSFGETVERAYCVAILNDTGKPVVLSRPDFKGDWKHPLVATEIGEALPHWEAALYLVDPQQIGRAARTLQLTFGAIVLLLVVAIVAGGSLIGADIRRQVRLAQQKTDFVSNVSHELKTPLTSIRMFADLLAEKRVPDEERQATYLRIIAAEASRLTRLINNVLDFARLERGAPPGEPRPCDLVEAVRDVVETCGPHLEAAGIAFQSEIEAETLPVRGDRDALAQIILNLISNAEKYGGQDILVRVRRQETAAGALGCVDVLDRGAGIPAREAKTIFEPFHRLDDSLSSGIPGSGLGLTLARRMARAHGGDVTYSARAGGGSCFTLTVPLGADLA